jgi:hypothetical protein
VLTQILSVNLKNELAGRESSIRNEFLGTQAQAGADTFLQAPDIYYAAAVLLNENLKIGDGDRTTILHTIMKKPNSCLAIKDKLILLQKVKYMGMKMFKDDFRKVVMDDLTVNRKFKYRLWLTLVRQKTVLSNEEYIEAFPDMKERAEVWYEAIDEEGNATMEKQMIAEYIKKRKKENALKA